MEAPDPEATPSYTEDEIDGWKLPQATRTAKKRNIDLGNLQLLEDIRCKLKLHLLPDKQTRVEVLNSLSDSANTDVKRRAELVEIYDQVIEKAKSLPEADLVVVNLNRKYPDFIGQLTKQKSKIKGGQSRCPILVLGETGAGKSSFINLLLGEDILPISFLSNTDVICEMSYDPKARAVIYPRDENTTHQKEELYREQYGSMHEFLSELGTYIQKSESTKRSIYKRAEIFLPLDVLKTGLFIVDSPGIGDTEELTELVLNYILEACAFIYVINSASAGGVQPGRLQTLLTEVFEKAFNEQREYRPQCAIFVCNKWDQVPVKEREAVMKDTVAKLQKNWPDCQESQIFPLSTKEAAYIQDKGYVSGRFAKTIQEILKLVPLSRQILLESSYRFLWTFCDKVQLCIETRLTDVGLSAEDVEMKRADAKDRLNKLKGKVETFFDGQKKDVNKQIKRIAEKLKKHMQSKEIITAICQFDKSDIPTQETWMEASVAVRAKLYEKLLLEIQTWEGREGAFKALVDKMLIDFRTHFPMIDDELSDVEKLLRGRGVADMTGIQEDEDLSDPFIPSYIKNKFERLNMGMRVLVGVSLSPVLLLGMAVRLPVWGAKELYRAVEGQWLLKKYEGSNADRKALVERYAKSTVYAITDPVKLEPLIHQEFRSFFTFIELQRSKVEHQIQVDLELLQQLEDEETTSGYINETFRPLGDECDIIVNHLSCFQLKHIERPKKEIPFSQIQISTDVVCKGLFCTVFRARSLQPFIPSHLSDITIRRNHTPIDVNNVQDYIREEDAYRMINRKDIVKWLGITKDYPNIYQIFEPLHASLRQHLGNLSIKGPGGCRTTFLRNTMMQVISGLNYLHHRDHYHCDLSLDTVAVTDLNVVKLTNITVKKAFPQGFFPLHETDSCILSYVHLRPDLLLSSGTSTHGAADATYGAADDMYGVGVMMWEMWAQDKIFQDEIDDPSNEITTLKDFAMYAKKLTVPKNCSSFAGDQGGEFIRQWYAILMKCLNGSILVADHWLNKWDNQSLAPVKEVTTNF